MTRHIMFVGYRVKNLELIKAQHSTNSPLACGITKLLTITRISISIKGMTTRWWQKANYGRSLRRNAYANFVYAYVRTTKKLAANERAIAKTRQARRSRFLVFSRRRCRCEMSDRVLDWISVGIWGNNAWQMWDDVEILLNSYCDGEGTSEWKMAGSKQPDWLTD